MQTRNIVNKYLDYCRYRKELDEKTLKAYGIDLRQFFDFCGPGEPDKCMIEDYVTDIHKRYRQKTVKRKLASVKAFYNYLEDEELISETPFRRIRVKFKEAVVLPRIIPREEIEALLNCMYRRMSESAVMGEKQNEARYLLRDLAVIETFFATGARVYEISNIRRECMDLNSGLLRIDGKGDKERYIQISDGQVLELLRTYYMMNHEVIDRCGFFFVNRNCGRFSEQSIRCMLKKYAEYAGIERHITPHMFRHSLATYLIEDGVDISCVQQIFGHSSIRTTQIYVHVAAGKQAEILREKHPRKDMKISWTLTDKNRQCAAGRRSC